MSTPEKPSGKKPSRLEAHNTKYANQFGIAQDLIPEVAQNPDWFVKPIEEPLRQELAPGVVLTAEKYTLPDGDFTNVFDACVAPDSPAKIKMVSFPKPKKPTHIFRDEPTARALENATFFYIVDDSDPVAKEGPLDGTLNWCMRDGAIVGLPSADRPALYEINGALTGRNVVARGSMSINGTDIDWVGGQSLMHVPKAEWSDRYDPLQPTVFNAGCVAIVKEQDNPHGLRMLEKETYNTPQHESVTALGVRLGKDGALTVDGIKEGGGMGLFEGNFILQLPTAMVNELNITTGTIIAPRTLDGIDLGRVGSALTMGPSVLEYFTDDAPRSIDLDRSFGQPPPFTDKRYARSIIFKDSSGIHLRVYDAVPGSTNCKGMTPREVAESLPKGTEWAFFCDGGQSSLIGTRGPDGAPRFYGNQHYATGKSAFMKARAEGESAPPKSMLLGRNRPLPSAIIITYDGE